MTKFLNIIKQQRGPIAISSLDKQNLNFPMIKNGHHFQHGRKLTNFQRLVTKLGDGNDNASEKAQKEGTGRKTKCKAGDGKETATSRKPYAPKSEEEKDSADEDSEEQAEY